MESHLDLSSKVIPIWVVNINGPTNIYTFHSRAKVLASLASLIESSLPESHAGMVVEQTADILLHCEDGAIPFVVINDSSFCVRKIELDRYNPLVKCLAQCYDDTNNEELKLKISTLFEDISDI